MPSGDPPNACWRPSDKAGPCAGPRRGRPTHADRGSQYTSAACRARIAQAGALPHFSRPGNPNDNAQAEVGWSILKTELLPSGSPFASLEKTRLEVA